MGSQGANKICDPATERIAASQQCIHLTGQVRIGYWNSGETLQNVLYPALIFWARPLLGAEMAREPLVQLLQQRKIVSQAVVYLLGRALVIGMHGEVSVFQHANP